MVMSDDEQREELNQSLACISDRHSQCEGKNCSCGCHATEYK